MLFLHGGIRVEVPLGVVLSTPGRRRAATTTRQSTRPTFTASASPMAGLWQTYGRLQGHRTRQGRYTAK